MTKPPTIHDVLEKLNATEKRVSLLEEETKWLKLILQAYGVDGPWVSPEVAGKVLGSSRDRVKADIDLAEKLRVNRQKSDMVYGIHYRNDQSHSASQPTWKVNIVEYAKITKIPPDQRKVG